MCNVVLRKTRTKWHEMTKRYFTIIQIGHIRKISWYKGKYCTVSSTASKMTNPQ